MVLQLESLRFTFAARESIHFAQGQSSNILRGAFGTIFRRIACVPECQSAAACDRRANCPYARMFEPAGATLGPSGLADWPRPFVFRASHLDGQTFHAGECFHFDLNLFETAPSALPNLVLAFGQLARDGLGAGRRKVELISVARLNEQGQQSLSPLELDLTPWREKISRLTVRFVTPTELKSGQQIAARPDFAILAARARDRISTLRELYGSGPLDIDFRGFGDRAGQVKMTRCDIRGVDIQRRSSRTGQVHSIGGFVGEAEYEGDLGEFFPFLRAAKWTGVGRQTVWGKGELAVLPAGQ